MKLISLFHRTPIKVIVEEQLYDAKRKFIEHKAAAEHHDAIAEMYQQRIKRLKGSDFTADDVTEFTV